MCCVCVCIWEEGRKQDGEIERVGKQREGGFGPRSIEQRAASGHSRKLQARGLGRKFQPERVTASQWRPLARMMAASSWEKRGNARKCRWWLVRPRTDPRAVANGHGCLRWKLVARGSQRGGSRQLVVEDTGPAVVAGRWKWGDGGWGVAVRMSWCAQVAHSEEEGKKNEKKKRKKEKEKKRKRK